MLVRAGVRVLAADLAEGVGQLDGGKQVPLIGAKQGELDGARQVVPQFLQFDGGVVKALGAQQGDHLAVGKDLAGLPGGCADQVADDGLEQRRIGTVVDHETAQRRGGVERDEPALGERPGAGQQGLHGSQPFRGGDDDGGAPVPRLVQVRPHLRAQCRFVV